MKNESLSNKACEQPPKYLTTKTETLWIFSEVGAIKRNLNVALEENK